jgi:hypothetical protein
MHEYPPDAELQAMIADPAKKRSKRTVELTLSNLRRLQERGLDIDDPPGVIMALRQSHKHSTTRTYVSAIINYLAASGRRPDALKAYRKELVQLEKDIGVDYHRTAFTDRQKAHVVGWDEVLEHRDALAREVERLKPPLRGRTLKTMYDHLLLSFYTMLAPGRNEYRMLRIVEDPPVGRGSKEENYYVKGAEQDTLVLHRYKTSKHYGKAQVAVPPALRDVVRRSLDLQPREYVFANFAKPSMPWTTQYMSNRMGGAMAGKRLGSALLRKIAITEFAKRGRGSRAALARAMRHKMETSEQYYNDRGKGEDTDMGFAL